jgi:hypothetical protein
MGARSKLRQYFLHNIGRVIDWKELQIAAGGITEWARRVRELRIEEGYQILTNNDRADLKPGQYLLESGAPLPALSRKISKGLRAVILERNGFTCQMCGAVAGEPHPYDPTRKTRLHIGHILDQSKGGKDERSNLRALCSVCNEGASNSTLPKPTALDLLVQLRRSSEVEQLTVLTWLIKKYRIQTVKVLQEKQVPVGNRPLTGTEQAQNIEPGVQS